MFFARGHGRGKGLLRVVPSHYLQRLRSRRRLRRVAFATCCCGISKLNAARGQYRQQRSCAAGQVSILREGTEASLEKRLRAVSVPRHAFLARAPAADTRLPLSGGSRILFPGNLQKGSDLLNGRFCGDAVFLTQYRDRTVFDELVRPTDSNNWCGNSSIR